MYMQTKRDRGIIGCMLMAVFSALLPVLHAVPDFGILWLPSSAVSAEILQLFASCYFVAGAIIEPFLIAGVILLALYFSQTKYLMRVGLFYAVTRVLFAAATFYFGWSVRLYAPQDVVTAVVFGIPGMVKGLCALASGAGGLAFSIVMAHYFKRRNPLAYRGAQLIALAVVVMIACKTLSMWWLPELMIVAFLLSSAVKSVGLFIIALALQHKVLMKGTR